MNDKKRYIITILRIMEDFERLKLIVENNNIDLIKESINNLELKYGRLFVKDFEERITFPKHCEQFVYSEEEKKINQIFFNINNIKNFWKSRGKLGVIQDEKYWESLETNFI